MDIKCLDYCLTEAEYVDADGNIVRSIVQVERTEYDGIDHDYSDDLTRDGIDNPFYNDGDGLIDEDDTDDDETDATDEDSDD